MGIRLRCEYLPFFLIFLFSPFLSPEEINFQGLIWFPLFHSYMTHPGFTSLGCGTNKCKRRKVGDENVVYLVQRLNICSELAILSLGGFGGRDRNQDRRFILFVLASYTALRQERNVQNQGRPVESPTFVTSIESVLAIFNLGLKGGIYHLGCFFCAMISLTTAFAMYQKEHECQCFLRFPLHLPFVIRIYFNNHTLHQSSKNVPLFLSEILHLVCKVVFNLHIGLHAYRQRLTALFLQP